MTKSTTRKHRAVTRQHHGFPARQYISYEYACTCGVTSRPNTSLRKTQRDRNNHLRTRHGQ